MSKKKQSNEHIQVYVRCRPLVKSELSVAVPVEVHPDVNKILVRPNGTDKCRTFSFDKVFGPGAKQADIYAEIVAPTIHEVIMGFNCTIFAYGQTGTGKTFTIEGGRTPGLEDISEDPLSGIIPRSMKHLFNDLTEQNMRFQIYVSFLELYNEEIFDLLSKSEDLVKLKMFDNSAQKGSVIVQGLEVQQVTSMKEVYDILDAGFKKRRKAATFLNKSSSRSHTVFTVTVKLRESSSTFERRKTGKLNLVDLAGSENIGRSGAIDKRAREAGNINQSLLALGRVITSLCERAGHIPYRESKLTRLLQDSLGGQTKTAIIATISPSAIHIDETLNTLEYALRAKNITNKPELNAHITASSLSKDYLDEINRLNRAIHEWGLEKGFYVSEEHLNHWKSALASKRKEKNDILEQIEKLLAEDRALDSALQEANNNLSAKRNELNIAKSQYEEYLQEIEKEKDEHKLHTAILQVMLPLHDHLHEALHEDIDEKTKLESEVMKEKDKLKSTVEDYRILREKLQNMRENWTQRREQFNRKARNLLDDIENMHENTNSLTSECNNYVSELKNSFDSAIVLCEKEFNNVLKATNDIEALNETFKENIKSMLNEEKSTKLKWIEDFHEAYLTSNEFSVLEPLINNLKDCENSLNGISSVISDWKTQVTTAMNARQHRLNEHLDNQNNALKSMTDCVKDLLGKQQENLDEYNGIITECISSEATNRKLWNDKFFTVEQALSSLDLFCCDNIQNEIEKVTRAEKSLTNFSKTGKEIAEKLSNYSETSVRNFDTVLKEADLSEQNALTGTWEEMKKNVDTSCAKYKDLNSELAKFTGISKDCDGIPSHIEDSLKNKFKALELPSASSHSEEMKELNSDLKKGIMESLRAYKTSLSENKAEIDLALTKDRERVEKLVESSVQLSTSFNHRIPNFIQCIEAELPGTLSAEEDTTMNFNRSETNTIENTFFDMDTTITSSEVLEEAPGNGCVICAQKTSDEPFHPRESVPQAAAIAQCSRNSSMNPTEVLKIQPERSKSFMSNFPQSPIRRPRSRSALSARRNLQFLDVEKLANQLLRDSSDEEQ